MSPNPDTTSSSVAPATPSKTMAAITLATPPIHLTKASPSPPRQRQDAPEQQQQQEGTDRASLDNITGRPSVGLGTTPSDAATPRSPVHPPPSSSQLVQNLKHKPDKWNKILSKAEMSQRDGSNCVDVNAAACPTPSPPPSSGDPLVASSAPDDRTRRLSLTVDALSSPATKDDADVNVAAAKVTSPTDGPRLRFPARLATAPLLARSNSSGAQFHSSSAKPGTSASTSLQSHSHKSFNANSNNGFGRRSYNRAGIPSLEAIGKKFAAKKNGSTGGEDASKAVAGPTATRLHAGESVTSPSLVQSPADKANEAGGPLNSAGPFEASALHRSTSGASSATTEAPVSSASMSAATSQESATTAESTDGPSVIKGAEGEGDVSTAVGDEVSPRTVVGTPSLSSDAAGPALSASSLHPLQNRWTLYYDSRATARAAQARQAKVGPGGAHQQTTFEAGLHTLATFQDVESYCRLFNWLKKPSRIGMNENLSLFKNGIMPMWEDKSNQNGGKWTIQLVLKDKITIDRCWTWLTMALVGEDFEDNDDLICGAVLSTRPRFYRIQVWLGCRNDVSGINAVGKRLVQLLDLHDDSIASQNPTPSANKLSQPEKGSSSAVNCSMEFSYHTSKHNPPSKTFFSIAGRPFSSSPSLPHFPNVMPLGGKVIPASNPASNHFNRPPGLLGHPGGMQRSVTTPSLASYAMTNHAMSQSNLHTSHAKLPARSNDGRAAGPTESDTFKKPSVPSMNWKERLGQQTKKPFPA